MPGSIDHPILGKLSWVEDLSRWEAAAELRTGCPIELGIAAPRFPSSSDNFEPLFQGGVALLAWAKRSEQECRELIADKLLALYNDTWADDEEETALTREEFMARIAPSSLERNVDGSGHYYWKDAGLFAGHWIELRFDAAFQVWEIGLAG